MVDRIEKALRKLTAKEQKSLKKMLVAIAANNLQGLDVKKLKNRTDIYRARKGSLRIIFSKKGSTIKILALERRSDTTYK